MAHRSLSLFLLLVVSAVSAFAQTEARNSTGTPASSTSAPARASAINPKYTTPKSPVDPAYGAKIAEYTTEKYFMT